MSVRQGSPKAVMALAHHMMAVVHQVLSRKQEYVELGGDYYDQRNKPKTVARLAGRLARLGYYVSLRPIDPEPDPALPNATAPRGLVREDFHSTGVTGQSQNAYRQQGWAASPA
jgi:hypothetical protein